MPGNPSLRRALWVLAAREESGKWRFVFLRLFQGDEDFSTPIDEVQRFKGLGLKNLSVKTYAGLGHSFSPNKNGQPTYGPIDQKVIADIVKAADGF